ncbi:TetR/AcrR family transcriptional regulator [Paraliomyxa miuraensis]|uniref:TetR/AcrR family transcriptional regulator n=1 Tax=Paraliomyxa miuraensis TaxID=376150 RepID=UPI002256C219|nr:WHG domain-containing protein [Paraliomyxa miuraensis]MCX4244666.1 WHG domain-containing protein [Paraliomyxa miuraensis]
MMQAVVRAGTEDSRRALLDAVGVVLAKEGLEGLSLRKVAAKAGLSHAAPGVLFGGRAAMLTEYAAEGFVALGRCLDEAERTASGGPSALSSVGTAYVLFAVDQPLRFQVMFRPDCLLPRDPDYLKACREAFIPLRRAIERGMDEGWIAAGEIEDVTLAAWSLVHGLAMLWFSKHLAGRVRPEPHTLAQRVTALFAGAVSMRGQAAAAQ